MPPCRWVDGSYRTGSLVPSSRRPTTPPCNSSSRRIGRRTSPWYIGQLGGPPAVPPADAAADDAYVDALDDVGEPADPEQPTHATASKTTNAPARKLTTTPRARCSTASTPPSTGPPRQRDHGSLYPAPAEPTWHRPRSRMQFCVPATAIRLSIRIGLAYVDRMPPTRSIPCDHRHSGAYIPGRPHCCAHSHLHCKALRTKVQSAQDKSAKRSGQKLKTLPVTLNRCRFRSHVMADVHPCGWRWFRLSLRLKPWDQAARRLSHRHPHPPGLPAAAVTSQVPAPHTRNGIIASPR
jgi:hypothetical protein